MITATEFVAARLDEDKAIARAAADKGLLGFTSVRFDRAIRTDGRETALSGWDERFLAAQTPARVLAQCESMRMIVDEYQAMRGVAKSLAEQGADGEAATARAMYAGMLRAIQALACIWSNHADFREEWRP